MMEDTLEHFRPSSASEDKCLEPPMNFWEIGLSWVFFEIYQCIG